MLDRTPSASLIDRLLAVTAIAVTSCVLGLALSFVLILSIDVALQTPLFEVFHERVRAWANEDTVRSLRNALIVFLFAISLISSSYIFLRKSPRTFLTHRGRYSWKLTLTGFLFSVLSTAIAILAIDHRYAISAMASFRDLDGRYISAALFIAGAFLFAMSEEILFRGWITSPSHRVDQGRIVLLVASTLAFCIAHLSWDPESLFLRIASGLAYGWCAIRLRGVEFSIGSHLGRNIALSCLLGGDTRYDGEAPLWLVVSALALGSALTIAVAEAVVRRERLTSPPR